MPPRRKPQPGAGPLSRELLASIADDGRTPFALARDAGVDEASLRRFLSRERSVSLDTADRLAAALGLRLVRKGRTQGKGLRTEPPGAAPIPES